MMPKQKELWIPNDEVAEKIISIQIECSLNEKYEKLENNTIFIEAMKRKDNSPVLDVAPKLKNTNILGLYERMLPFTNGDLIYASVYSKTGGVLNLFNEKISKNIDIQFKELSSKSKDKNQAIKEWKNEPSELWSGLTPAQIWAGGGKVEKVLLMDFLNKLTELMNGKQFTTKGAAFMNCIDVLRTWQLNKNDICDGKTPMEAIIEERNLILKDKIDFIKENNIECDYK
ncbi:hypothetical protein A0J52_18245 [Clostridium sporogenes]|uniref:hypothetical protein n=1 Tax=Clostridium sporogenes TaxID=1509 RepID=UPI00077FF168|nr:hypothetical protein [Clostridium sporogenes]KYN75670.1 hypothetical protein A0J52_18245 [Clostridium sporogenes]MCW6061423.1 hypothetical protein [Clostridium sporogenes]MCW6067640.1 hypothetical protein [Clostridium sporogenes]NFM17800.1 hypothetical protein [Clostridium sporogenes]